MKNKRGSHVGMILSFMLFITFVVFLYSVLSPAINTGESKKSTLDFLKTQIMNNVSSNFTTAGLQITNTSNPSQSCVVLQNFLLFMEIAPPYNLIVKNETGSIQPSYIVDISSADMKINRKNRNNLFFRVYIAQEFNSLVTNNSISCSSPVDEYSISSVKTDSYVFEKDLRNFISYYNSSYDSLKTALKVPVGNEFGIDFTQNNGTKISAGDSSKQQNVYADEIPIQYIDQNANILSGFINIRVW